MLRSLAGLNAVITGGVSSLSAVIARRLAAEGVNICLNGLPMDADAAVALCATLAANHNVSTTFVLADASAPDSCAKIIQHAVDVLGGVDIIIANTGCTKFEAWDDLDAFSEDEWLQSFKINTLSPLWLFKAAAPLWKAAYESDKTTGVIVSTNSLAGLTSMGSIMPQSVTEAGQLRIIEGIAYNNGPWARANAVCPGHIITPWSMRYGEDKINAMVENTPLKKPVDLEVSSPKWFLHVD